MRVFTAQELADNGITKRNVEDALRKAEKLCNWFSDKNIKQGVSAKEQSHLAHDGTI